MNDIIKLAIIALISFSALFIFMQAVAADVTIQHNTGIENLPEYDKPKPRMLGAPDARK